MGKAVRLAGCGLVTALGSGREQNMQGIKNAKGMFRTKALDQFSEHIEAPFLSVDSGFSNIATNSGQTQAHMEWMLDQAIEEAFEGIELSAEVREEIPVFIGSSSYGIGLGEALYNEALEEGENAFPIPLDGFTQIGNYLRLAHGLNGADYAFNTACTASANALLSATNLILSGKSRYALVIGIETYNTTTLSGFYGMQLLADNPMRPFDKARNGLVLGEGCAVLLLSLTDQTQKGLTFCGGASRCDTFSISASNPDGSSIAEVMQDALSDASISASDVVAIKAHGTASPLNDDGEAAGMKRVFEEMPPFFALKSYVGHTLGGCGAIETALMTESLKHQEMPVSAGFVTMDDALGVAPLVRPQEAREGYYMLNFFGFGGNNCSIVVHSSNH